MSWRQLFIQISQKVTSLGQVSAGWKRSEAGAGATSLTSARFKTLSVPSGFTQDANVSRLHLCCSPEDAGVCRHVGTNSTFNCD